MKSNLKIEKLTDWHYNPLLPSDGDLKQVDFVVGLDRNQRTLTTVKSMIEAPYELGGVKRVHIGSTAIKVANNDINERCRNMMEAGYDENQYFIEFNNDILDGLSSLLKRQFNLSYEHHCAIIVPPGQCMPAHGDTYSYLMKMMSKEHPDVRYDLKKDTRRYLIFLTDWEWGQSIGAGNELKWQWRIGEVYSWKHKLLHWSSNAGFNPIVFFEITGLELEA